VKRLRNVGVVLHPRRDSAEAIEAILRWARQRNARVLGLPHEVSRIGDHVICVDPDDLAGMADLVVSLGGDGTMLRAMRLAQPTGVPVLGVNLGRLGFLAELDVPELDSALCAIDEHRFTVEPRVAIRARFCGTSAIAFNDIVLVRYPGEPVGAVDVHVEGHRFVRYAADAVIVATPTGSTAYSFSASGPIVSPRAEGLLVVPSASHSAFNRAVFLSRDERLELEVLQGSGRLAVEVDGALAADTACPGERVQIELGEPAGKVVRLGTTTFYQRVRRKLRLSDPAELDGSGPPDRIRSPDTAASSDRAGPGEPDAGRPVADG
jgi:NAD+ kinase